MSVAEIIEMIEKLPPDQKAEVVTYARNVSLPKDQKTVRYISDEKFAEVAPQIFEKHKDLMRRLSQ